MYDKGSCLPASRFGAELSANSVREQVSRATDFADFAIVEWKLQQQQLKQTVIGFEMREQKVQDFGDPSSSLSLSFCLEHLCHHHQMLVGLQLRQQQQQHCLHRPLFCHSSQSIDNTESSKSQQTHTSTHTHTHS